MIAYFNCTSGISGDMILGALVDAGVPIETLKRELSNIPVRGYELKTKKVKRAGILATKVDVIINSKLKTQNSKIGKHGHTPSVKQWKDIEKIIRNSKLSDNIKQKGLHIFKRLFEAEARVHGEKFRDVHLHELGAADCIVDIFGALIGLDILGIDTIYSSALNVGSGTIRTGHGMLPVPAPATVELLKGIPVYSSGIKFELSTPTGAVLISSLAKGFGQIPQMKISKTGIGAGNKDFKGQPNVLTMIIGEKSGAKDQVDTTRLRRSSRYDSLPRVKGSKDRTQYAGCRMQDPEHKILVIETNIDDMNPQVYEYVMGELFKAGALDVFLTQIIMKKGRPGIKLTVLCSNDNQEDLTNIILKQTTSIGVRFYEAQRRVLERKIDSVNTKFGKIRVKISKLGDKTVKVTPEYEDCRKAARKYNIPLTDVIKDVNSKTGN